MTDDKKTPPLSAPTEEGERRARLVQTAAALFAEKGFDGVSTRDIATAAQVNISLISYYFNGKEGLYLAVLEDFTKEARQRMAVQFEGFDPEGMTRESYLKQMSLVIRHVVELKFRTPYVSSLMHRELLSGMPHAREFVNEMFQTMAQTLINLVLTAQKKGIIRKDLHVPTYFMTMMHSMDTYFLFTRCDTLAAAAALRLPEQMDEYCDQMVKLFIEGVLE